MKNISKHIKIVLAVFTVVVVFFAYILYQNYTLNNQNKLLKKELSKKTLELSNATSTILSLKNDFNKVEEEKNKLKGDLNNEISKMVFLQDQVRGITGTVGTLKKLSKTDKELLQKYSKVYFLNENYIPSKLVQINTEYLYDKNMDKWIHKSVWSFLKNMLNDAKNSGMDILVASAYRSFDTQVQLKNRYTTSYGSGANKFSADQGYSEHQLGTTIDFTTLKTKSRLSSFEDTDTYKWLTDNAYKYGFILSYPKKNGYYIFEPWHFRFVGVKLAKKLHDEGVYFYDLSQREIDEYLVNIFD